MLICSGHVGALQDLWKYDLNTNQWTWVSGSKAINQPSFYHQVGVPHADNIPAARYGGCMWEATNHG